MQASQCRGQPLGEILVVPALQLRLQPGILLHELLKSWRQSVAFRVQGTDPAGGSLAYRWDFGDYNSTSIAHGGTATDTGTYRVAVTNSAGSTTSNYVDCQVDEPPAITAVSVEKGGVFKVAATGTRLNYWLLGRICGLILRANSVSPKICGTYGSRRTADSWR